MGGGVGVRGREEVASVSSRECLDAPEVVPTQRSPSLKAKGQSMLSESLRFLNFRQCSSDVCKCL